MSPAVSESETLANPSSTSTAAVPVKSTVTPKGVVAVSIRNASTIDALPDKITFLVARPEVAAFVDARTTPHPTACFTQAIKLTGGIDRVKKKTYIYANVPAPTTFTPFYEKLKNNKEWTVHTLPCTHIVQMDLPDELSALLLRAIP